MDKLKEEAGLVLAGKNYDGEDEWIGTKAQWERYEELAEANGTPEVSGCKCERSVFGIKHDPACPKFEDFSGATDKENV